MRAAVERAFSPLALRALTGIWLTAIAAFLLLTPVRSDSSSPLLHAYYDRFAAIVEGKVYVWRDGSEPRYLATKRPVQVGTSRQYYFVLEKDGRLMQWSSPIASPATVARNVRHFSPGASGLFVIDRDNNLWLHKTNSKQPVRVASNVITATIGDGANYYVDVSGRLFVKGLAHRGQYGDGRLEPSKDFVQTGMDVKHVRAHTGHAILLKRNGEVYGTGGNIYGPVGRHGLGDKAIRWSKILSGVKAIATGASHSLAIGRDNTLYAWGSGYGVEPKRVLSAIRAVAAGTRSTIALDLDNILWRWTDALTPQKLSLPR